MFAVIRTGGKQYKVSPGEVITIERLPSDDSKLSFGEVLLVGGEKTLVGKPIVEQALVKAERVSDFRGEKLRVFKYRPKVHYQKTIGHRQNLTQVKIIDIVLEDKPKKGKES